MHTASGLQESASLTSYLQYTSALPAGAFLLVIAKWKTTSGLAVLSTETRWHIRKNKTKKNQKQNMTAMHTLTFWSQSCKNVIRRGCAVSN